MSLVGEWPRSRDTFRLTRCLCPPSHTTLCHCRGAGMPTPAMLLSSGAPNAPGLETGGAGMEHGKHGAGSVPSAGLWLGSLG